MRAGQAHNDNGEQPAEDKDRSDSPAAMRGVKKRDQAERTKEKEQDGNGRRERRTSPGAGRRTARATRLTFPRTNESSTWADD